MSLESGVLRYKSGVSMKRNCSHFEGWLSCQRWWGLVFRRRNRRPLLQQSKYFPHNYLGKYFPQKVKPKPLYLRAIWSGLGAIDILGAINFARKRHRDPVQLLPPESTPSLSLTHTHTRTHILSRSLSLSLPPSLPPSHSLPLALPRSRARGLDPLLRLLPPESKTEPPIPGPCVAHARLSCRMACRV